MPWINKKECVSCKKCVKKCPVDAIDMVKSKASIAEDKCINCGKCIKICPVKAIFRDNDLVEINVRSNLKRVKGSLSLYNGKKAKKRMIKSQLRQIKRQQKVLRKTKKELKDIKI